MNFRLIINALVILFITASCNSKSTKEWYREWKEKAQPEYDCKNQVIYFKEELDHDIKVDIAPFLDVDNNGNFNFKCQLSYFNYGDEIKLYTGLIDDVFSPDVGDINFAYALEETDQIKIRKENISARYGEWYNVDLVLQGDYVTEVFMTPLAVKAYKKEGNTTSLIFIQFITKNNFMNVLFSGGPKESVIVSDFPNLLLTRCMQSHSEEDNGVSLGRFWEARQNY